MQSSNDMFDRDPDRLKTNARRRTQKLPTIILISGIVLLIFLGIVTRPSVVSGVMQVIRPRRAIDQKSGVRTVAPGDDLQEVVNAAAPGDTIVLQAGARYAGKLVLPRKNGNAYITIQSSRAAELANGVRVTPAQAPLMAKLVSPGSGQSVINTALGAHHYKFVGIEFAPQNASAAVYTLVELGSANVDQSTLAAVPHDLIFDRCYVHGFTTQSVQRGIALNSAETSVLNSWISDIHWDIDTQALCGWNGPGPFHIINNHLEAAGENVMFGGATVRIAGLVPSDIEIRRNHIYKPLSWKKDDPSYGGIHWSVKNHLELKNGRRVVVEGNIFENIWGDAQDGYSVQLTPRQDPYAVVEDVTFVNNIFRNAAGGINFLGVDNYGGGPQQTRIKVVNNLFEVAGPEPLFQISNLNDLVIDHNTAIHPGNIITHYGSPTTGFVFTNNIVERNKYGIIASGDPPIDQYFPGAVIKNNGVVSPSPQYFPNWGQNVFVSTLAEVRFVDPSVGNYRLSPASPFKGRGVDKKNPGVDFDALEAAVNQVVAGQNGTRPERSAEMKDSRKKSLD